MTRSNQRAWAILSAMGLAGLIYLVMHPQSETPSQGEIAAPKSEKLISAKQLKQLSFENPKDIIFVNLWATWCAPCQEEIPDLVKLHKKYMDKGFRLYLIQMEDEKAWSSGDEMLAKLGASDYGHQRDPQEDFFDKLGEAPPNALPYSFLLKAGEMSADWTGSRSFSEMELELAPHFE